MTEFSVNYGQIQQAVSDITTATALIEAELNDVVSDLAPVEAGWLGDAKESYKTHKHAWDLEAAEMGRLLGVSGQALNNMAENYDSDDKRIAAGWAL